MVRTHDENRSTSFDGFEKLYSVLEEDHGGLFNGVWERNFKQMREKQWQNKFF